LARGAAQRPVTLSQKLGERQSPSRAQAVGQAPLVPLHRYRPHDTVPAGTAVHVPSAAAALQVSQGPPHALLQQ
jgi:hypothetical protein